jgi:hypothetical protein
MIVSYEAYPHYYFPTVIWNIVCDIRRIVFWSIVMGVPGINLAIHVENSLISNDAICQESLWPALQPLTECKSSAWVTSLKCLLSMHSIGM